MKNGNGKAGFTIDRITVFEAKLMESGKWRSAVAQNSSADNEPPKKKSAINRR